MALELDPQAEAETLQEKRGGSPDKDAGQGAAQSQDEGFHGHHRGDASARQRHHAQGSHVADAVLHRQQDRVGHSDRRHDRENDIDDRHGEVHEARHAPVGSGDLAPWLRDKTAGSRELRRFRQDARRFAGVGQNQAAGPFGEPPDRDFRRPSFQAGDGLHGCEVHEAFLVPHGRPARKNAQKRQLDHAE